MDVTTLTWIVAISGLLLGGLLFALQSYAGIQPRAESTIRNVYGGDPTNTYPKAYFAVNQGWAWADAFFWCPLEIVGCVGMLLGEQWGFLLALMASVPFVYTAIQIFIWDRAMGVSEEQLRLLVRHLGNFPRLRLCPGRVLFPTPPGLSYARTAWRTHGNWLWRARTNLAYLRKHPQSGSLLRFRTSWRGCSGSK